jgi:hypothetical protein
VQPRRLEWIERTLGPETIRNGAQPGNDPAKRYPVPRDVLCNPVLSQSEKHDVLRRWALDAYLIESGLSKGDAVPGPSRLDEVIDALIDLDEPELRRIVDRASRLTGLSPGFIE